MIRLSKYYYNLFPYIFRKKSLERIEGAYSIQLCKKHLIVSVVIGRVL